MKNLPYTLFSLVLLCSAGPAIGADLVWTNSAGGSWNSPANWNPNQVPGLSDHAFITQPGNYAVGLTANQTVGAFTLGATSGSSTQTLSLNGRVFAISGLGRVHTHGVLNLNGGNLGGGGTNRIDGVLNWTAGDLSGATTLIVGSEGVLNIETGGQHDLPGITLINEGVVVWNAGQIRGGQGTLIQNQGRWIAKADNQINGAFGGAISFNNLGLFEVPSGTASLLVSGSSSGEFNVAAGAVCSFHRPHAFLDGAAFTGAGINRLADGAFVLEGDIRCQSVELNGGSLSGTHRLVGAFNWVSGSLAANSTTTIPDGSTFNIISGNLHDLAGHTLINEGVVAWNAGQIRGGQGSVIQNKGRWVAMANSQINNAYGGPGVFNNLGLVEIPNDSTVFFVNGESSGEVRVAGGALCSFNLANTFRDGASFTGAGIARLSSGVFTLEGTIQCQSLELNGGSLSGTHRLAGSFNWVNGLLNGGSTTTIPDGSTLNIVTGNLHDLPGHTLINEGVVVWSGGQIRGGQGSVIENKGRWIAKADSQINVGYGGAGTFNNSGTYDVQEKNSTLLTPGTSTGIFRVATGLVSLFGAGYNFDNGTAFRGEGINRLSNGVKTLNGIIVSDNLEIEGGSIRGIHTLVGTVNWVSGVLDVAAEQPGVTTIAPGATFNIVSGNLHDLPGHTLINEGTVVWTGGQVRNGLGSVIENKGLWIARTSSQINAAYGGVSAFNNSGVFDVQNASVTFVMPGASTGTFNVGAEALCVFSTSHNYNNGTSFTGAGINRLQAGQANLNGTIFCQNLELVGGTLIGDHTISGTGSFQGLLTWISGDMISTGTTTIGNNATLHITTGNAHDLPSHVLINNGTVRWSGGLIRGGNGASIQNNGLWLVEVDSRIDNAYGGALTTFHNAGTFRKTGSAGTSTIQIEFGNSGTVDLQTGDLSLAPVNGTPYIQTGGLTQLGGGRLSNANGVQIRAGGLGGIGVVQGNVVSSGFVAPSGSGSFTIEGNFTQEGEGTTQFELGGTSPGVNYSRFHISGRASLSGSASLRTINGFVPAATDTFDVMSFGSRRGAFQCYNGFILLGHDRQLTAEYGPTLVTLKTEAKPDPAGPSLTISRLTQGTVMLCWPEEFPGYRLQSTEDVVSLPILWTDVPLTSSNKVIINPTLAMEFFRLVKVGQ
ncbi:MAG: hypothetical protein JNN07_16270 [Verrucomicrobiales bacterium]|nr:hypothetical protein [Verrucomicrobiales bacterium]